jgi:hypothetical protein
MAAYNHYQNANGNELNDPELNRIMEIMDIPKVDPDIQRLYFFSVGSAANMSEKRVTKLEQNDIQQYPPLVQKLGMEMGMETHLILMDPVLTNPPYIVQHMREIHNLDPNDDQHDYQHDYQNGDYYFYPQINLHVHVFKIPVNYQTIPSKNGNVNVALNYDITPILYQFNEHCKETNNLLIFHDFSGRDTWKLAEHMDNHPSGSKNASVLYDISMRRQGSCYVDLNDPFYNVKMDVDNNNKLVFFNPFHLRSHEIINMIKKMDPFRDANEINQLLYVVKRNIYLIKNYLYPVVRRSLVFIQDYITKPTREEKSNLVDKFKSRMLESDFVLYEAYGYMNLYRNINSIHNNDSFPYEVEKNVKNMIKIMCSIIEHMFNGIRFSHNDMMSVHFINLNLYKWMDYLEQDIKEWKNGFGNFIDPADLEDYSPKYDPRNVCNYV